ncbi:MAG TPA: 4-demethylwyosine synthase TYW1 [Candidatus Paceibacterota bacterium]|nr:4-demethylwyosine synthase TYW1 [Candidatus Paceibacterota bacterium]
MLSKTKNQISDYERKILEKQQYRIIGSHSAVKTCSWTKHSINNTGNCYKSQFYGIDSSRCIQMTTSFYCANRCKFCWRGLKAPVSKKWYGETDNPKFIVENSIKEHIKLLQGFKGQKSIPRDRFINIENPKHVALSLTGEAITYPKINQLLTEFHKKEISTFLVTNAQFPDMIKKIKNITQLYLSIDAPNKKVMKEIDRPLFQDFWERTLKSLKILSSRKYRTSIRLTLIKNNNMEDVEGYSKLINIGKPHFVEIKSYMWVGESQKQFNVQDMPRMDEIKDFTKKLLSYLPEYELVDENIPSRVSLIKRKDFKKQYINFKKFFELVNKSNKKIIKAEDYSY